MSNYNSLKTTIDANIKQNGRQEITGQILNTVLNQMVNILGTGYQFAGVATTATNPGTPDAKVFYIANGKGTYTNFGGLEVTEDEVVVLYWDSSWHKEATGIASNEKLTELESKFDFCNVNFQNGVPNTAYADAETARAAVPENFRKYGLVIAYKLSDGWHIEQYIYPYSVNPWVTAGGWWKVYDYKPEYTVYNLNANNSTTTYTLAEAIAAVPSEYRTIARAIIFRQTNVGTTLALFNANAYVSGWTDTNNWITISSETLTAWNAPVEKLQFDAFLQAYQDKRLNIPTRKIKAPINLPLVYGQMYVSGVLQKRGDGMRYEEIIISPTAKYYYTGTARADGNAMVTFKDKNGLSVGSAIIGTGQNVSYTEEELTIPQNAVTMQVGSFIVPGYNELQIVVEDYAYRFVERYGTNDLWAKKYTDVPLTLEVGKNIQVDGTIVTYSSGGCSQLISVDHSKKYKLETRVDQYCCGVAFYSDVEGTQCVGFQVTSYAQKTIAEIIDIPSDAVTMRVGTRDSSICNLYEVEYVEAAPLQGLKALQEEIQHIETDFVSANQGASNYGKVLVVGADGKVTLGNGSGGDPTANAVVEHQGKTLYLGADIINNPQVTLGDGWSGTLANGFTHSAGTTTDLVIKQATIAGKKYLIECQLSVASEASIFLSIGNSPKVDVYTGETSVKVGIISPDGGFLNITPASSFAGIVSAIHIKEIVDEESAVETLNINVNNIENGTMVDNLTGFWNVALGTINTMQHNQNGSRNIVAGYSAMAQFQSGTRNVMLGTFAGCNLESGDRNIAIGADAFWYAQTGKDNIAIGYAAMGRMDYSHPSSNIAIGSQALGFLQADAFANVAIGKHSCNYSGKRNVGIGEYANYYSRGNDNVAIGHYSQGFPYETGEQNVSIGAFARCGNLGTAQEPETINNAIAIGYNAVATKSNQVVIGNADHTEFVLGTKKIIFNPNGSVEWETI